jgi:hypothetical protein
MRGRIAGQDLLLRNEYHREIGPAANKETRMEKGVSSSALLTIGVIFCAFGMVNYVFWFFGIGFFLVGLINWGYKAREK